jgi:hypothetical protein
MTLLLPILLYIIIIISHVLLSLAHSLRVPLVVLILIVFIVNPLAVIIITSIIVLQTATLRACKFSSSYSFSFLHNITPLGD